MPETDKAPVFYSGKSKELSELVNDHFECIEGLAERFREAIKERLESEESSASEEEKSILLDLSNKIAASGNKDDLFDVVQTKLKKLFAATGFVIILTSTTGHDYRIYEFNDETYRPDGKGLNDADLLTGYLPESLLEHFSASSDTVMLDVSSLSGEFPDTEFFKTGKDKSADKIAVVVLKVGGEILGFLLLQIKPMLFGAMRVNLLKGVCAQLSVALSNIMLIEETLRRKNEMELLLRINSAIATIRNKEELALVIKDNFKQLLGCSHTLITVCDEDGLTVSAFLLDEDASAKWHPAYRHAKEGHYPLNDLLLSKVLRSDSPVFFDLEEMALQQDIPLYIKINIESGQKTLMITRFAKGEEVFGFWLLYFKEKKSFPADKLKLVQSLSHQLCIAVANIIAHQEIKRRKRKKERLLKFSNAIASVRDKLVLSQILKDPAA